MSAATGTSGTPGTSGTAPLGFVDLVEVPFTVPGSRFLVVRGSGEHAGSLEVLHVRYEVPLDECLVLRLTPRAALRRRGGAGPTEPVEPVEVTAGRLRWCGAELALLDDELRLTGVDDLELVVERGPAPDVVHHDAPGRVVVHGTTATPSPRDDAAFAAAADAVVEDWMALVPSVLPARQEMARQCWWVLGANQVDVARPGGDPVRVVVPSKRGYVALWQWDTYFIALGLRHTAPGLALDQLDVALTPGPDGQLPDVVHDDGVLASSADLPAADRERLLAQGSPTTSAGEVPLTKPPLTAWAADLVLDRVPPARRREWLRRRSADVLASQDWWFAVSDSDGDGLPEYLHPYSSGLDDSPVFDHALPVLAPDLLAYLVVQDETLARWARELAGPDGDDALPRRLEERAARVRAGLAGLWDGAAGMLRPRADGAPVPERTIVSLLGCFAGGLPAEQVAGILADVQDPARFGAPWPLPTVAQDDPGFDPLVMWRGPTWVNTAYLVAEGLERCGEDAAADRLRGAVLDLVETAGGPVEYADPRTGRRCPGATTAFGWSAALYLDLAVREAGAVDAPPAG